MVCIVRFIHFNRISFNKIANAIGMIVFQIIFPIAINIVLKVTCQISGKLKMYLKLSNPTKVELRKPFAGLKSWKAITTPNIGI